MREPLFVYGTLRPAHAPPELAAVVRTLRRLGPARVHGRLYDLGRYPAAHPDPADPGWIEGELVALGPASPPLAWFDAYEGFDPQAPAKSLFRRERTVAVGAEGREVPCWIYAWGGEALDAPHLPDGRWRRR
jgi:gamma-glutamylcyclotransferase (GGCT)/AIG2-like uncharacterized protein YtfP